MGWFSKLLGKESTAAGAAPASQAAPSVTFTYGNQVFTPAELDGIITRNSH